MRLILKLWNSLPNTEKPIMPQVYSALTPLRWHAVYAISLQVPDAYGRGRIIGDYRRIALYGVDALIQEKKEEKDSTFHAPLCTRCLSERENCHRQIRALEDLKELGNIYGF